MNDGRETKKFISCKSKPNTEKHVFFHSFKELSISILSHLLEILNAVLFLRAFLLSFWRCLLMLTATDCRFQHKFIWEGHGYEREREIMIVGFEKFHLTN